MSSTHSSATEEPVAPALLAALQNLQDHEDDASRWLTVALEFRVLGQAQQAIEACEAALKVNPRLIEGWVMIAELARAIGHNGIADEAIGVIRELSPDDARLSNL